MEELQPFGELGKVLEHVQVRGGQGQMGHRIADPSRASAMVVRIRGDDVAVGFHHVRLVRFLEQAEPAERDAPGGGPGVDPAQSGVRPYFIDPFLVLVPLFLRDQQLARARGSLPSARWRRARRGAPAGSGSTAAARARGVRSTTSGLGGGVGCAGTGGRCAATGTTRTRSVRPVGNGSPPAG